MLYRDYLSFCHLDEKRYSVTRGTDQGQEGYVSMATLLNSQSEVSSWSSQEVNVSQPQGQCEICQGQLNGQSMIIPLGYFLFFVDREKGSGCS